MGQTQYLQKDGRTSSVMALHGQMMTRIGAIFSLGLVAVVPFGVLSIFVTTRYLNPTEYGQLAVFFAIASVLTMFCGVGYQQGAMIRTFGIADDGDGDGDAIDIDEDLDLESTTVIQASDERRRFLGSGLLVVLWMTTATCGVAAAIGVVLAETTFGTQWIVAILWMCASAWAGGLWRMIHQVPRMERKAVRWAWLQWVRPALVVLGSLIALIAGFGLSGVLAATAIGTLLSTVAAYFACNDSFFFEFRREDLGEMWEAGRAWVPLIFAVAIQTNVSILLLAVVATPASVGLFQVASRIGQFPIYFTDGFVTAWPALERSPLSFAAKEEKGLRKYSASVFTLLALCSLGLLLFVCLGSDALIHIAAPSYASAASLIPIIAANGLAYVAFRGAFRATGFKRRRYWYTLFHLLWVIPYAAVVALLLPINVSYGVAIAQVVAGASIAIGYVMIDRHSSRPTPFEWKRLGLATLAAAACVLAVQLVPIDGPVKALVSIAAMVAFPLLLLAFGALPMAEIRTVLSIMASILPRIRWRAQTTKKVAETPAPQRQAVRLINAEGRKPAEAAAEMNVSESIALARMVRGLRHIAGEEDRSTPYDHLVGQYVLHQGSTIEKDVMATHLRTAGIDPLELYILDDAAKLAVKVPAEAYATDA